MRRRDSPHIGRESPRLCRWSVAATGRTWPRQTIRRTPQPDRTISWRCPSAVLFQFDEHDMRRVADGRVLASEREDAGAGIDAKGRKVVRPLVAAIEKPAARLERETARIIAARP